MKSLAWALGAAVALGLSTSAAFAADTTLRISLQLPLKSHLGQNLLLFKEEVEKNSNGDIAVEIYDSAQLYKDKEVPAAVGSGAIEMGVASLTRYVGDIPAVDIFYQPFLFDTEDKVRAAVAPGSPVRGPLDEAIKDTGSTVLWWQAYGGAIMLSQGGPLKTPDDMKGKKVRVFGKTLGDFVTSAGGAPTLISGSEQYLAYQRGNGRYRHDRGFRREIEKALGSHGHDFRDQPCRYRVHCCREHRLLERIAGRAESRHPGSSAQGGKRRAQPHGRH